MGIMHPLAFLQFVEEGNRRLAAIEDPVKRDKLARSLLRELVHRFPSLAPVLEDLSCEGVEDLSYRDVEDQAIQSKWDREESRDASDFVTDGCYSGDCEGDRVSIPGMMKTPTAKDFGQIFRYAPDVRTPFLRGIVDAPVAPDAVDLGEIREDDLLPTSKPDSVDLGEIWTEQTAEKMGGQAYVWGQLFTREARRKWRVGRGRGDNVVRTTLKACVLCDEKFSGSANASFCERCRAPKYREMRKQLKERGLLK